MSEADNISVEQIDARLHSLALLRGKQSRLRRRLYMLKHEIELEQRNVAELEQAMHLKQADIDELNRLSLKGLLHAILGSKREQLSKKQKQHYAAALRHQHARDDLAHFLTKEQHLIAAIASLDYVHNEDRRLRELRQRLIAQRDQPRMIVPPRLHVSQTAEADTDMEVRLQEIDEAITAGEYADKALRDLTAKLHRAQAAGGIIEFFTHQHRSGLDMPRQTLMIEFAYRSLIGAHRLMRRFQRELNDVLDIIPDDLPLDELDEAVLEDMNPGDRMFEAVEFYVKSAAEASRQVNQALNDLYNLRTQTLRDLKDHGITRGN